MISESEFQDAFRRRVDQQSAVLLRAPVQPIAAEAAEFVALDPPRRRHSARRIVTVASVAAIAVAAVAIAANFDPAPERQPIDVAIAPSHVESAPAGDDVAAVGRVLDQVALQFPNADGGAEWDDDGKQFTRWVVVDAPGAEELAEALRSAFETANQSGVFRLKIEDARLSIADVAALTERIAKLERDDPNWPERIEVSGWYSPRVQAFVMPIGDDVNSPSIVQYFADRFGSDVVLTGDPTIERQPLRLDAPASSLSTG